MAIVKFLIILNSINLGLFLQSDENSKISGELKCNIKFTRELCDSSLCVRFSFVKKSFRFTSHSLCSIYETDQNRREWGDEKFTSFG